MSPKVGVTVSMQAAENNGEVSSGCRGVGGTGNLGKNAKQWRGETSLESGEKAEGGEG